MLVGPLRWPDWLDFAGRAIDIADIVFFSFQREGEGEGEGRGGLGEADIFNFDSVMVSLGFAFQSYSDLKGFISPPNQNPILNHIFGHSS